MSEAPVASTSSAPMAGTAAPKASTIAVRLSSRTGEHAIPEAKYMLPADWRRFQLSELINKVLASSEDDAESAEIRQPIPFDFIINEELLRSSLDGYIKAKGLTEETTLEIEYVESILPPKYLSAFEHEDWVSDVDLSEKGLFLTSAYDGNVRIFSSTGTGLSHTLSGQHTLPVLSTCWLPSSSTSRHVASGGMDRVIRVWQIPNGEDSSIEAVATHALSLHTSAVSSVRAAKSSSTSHGSQRQLLSAGWDGLVGFWDFSLDTDGQATTNGALEDGGDGPSKSKKRRRGGASSQLAPLVKVEPTLVLSGHTGQVSRAIFDNSSSSNGTGKAYTFGSEDHSVRSWDLANAGMQTGSKTSDKAIMDADQLASPNLLVTGNADRTVCLWDMREANAIISLTMTGHSSSVSSISAHPVSPLLFNSASYDGTVRIWDARSPKQALFSIPRHNESRKGSKTTRDGKLLCTAWDGGKIASGGEDGRLELFQSKGV